MAYDLATVTNSGNQLLASVVPDKSSLVIDKIEVSGTQLASSTDLKTMTSISNVVQTLSANGYQKKDNSFIISTVLDNSSVDADYQAWVFGIWAHKADGGSSILMSVITSTDSPDTISKGSGTPIDYNYKFITTFSNTKSLKIKMSSDTYATNDTVLHNSGDETATGTKTFQEIKISNKKFPSLVQTDGQYVTLDGGNTEIVPADNSKVVHTTGDETIDGKKKFDTDPTDGAGNAYAKTVDVNQQLDKKVNVADMRKPASDVAGIEEVNTKQDKIGYTPADDSKVVHDNHDGTVQINGYNIHPFDAIQNTGKPYGLDFNSYINSGNYRFDNVTTSNYPPMAPYHNYWQLIVFGDGNSIYQIAIGHGITATRQFFAGSGWASWMQVADYANVVHTADMRKPASDVAGIEEVNAKQDKINYTPADDSKVVHSTDTSNWQKQAMFNPGDFKIDITSSTTDFATLLRSKYNKAGIVYIRDGFGWPVTNAVVICEGTGWWYAYGVNSDGNFVHRRIRESDDTGWIINADDIQVVHSKDMRKPASDVAGIEEVNAKQDKIAYTPADDSKVFHSTINQLNSTDMNTVLTAGFYKLNSGTNGMPNADAWVLYQVITLGNSNGVQVAYGTNNTILGMRSWNNYAKIFTNWVQFADDSKVAHLSGANNFDTVPTVNNNPLLLASSLPSDLARTGQANTFNLTQTFSQGAKTLQTGSYDDTNSLVNEGLYYNTNSSIKNGAASLTTGYIQVMSGGGEIVRQIMYSDTDGGVIYDRTSQNGGSSWSNWIQIVTFDQIPWDVVLLDQDANFTAKLQQNGQDVALANHTLARNPDTGKATDAIDFDPGKLTIGGNPAVSIVMCTNEADAKAKSAVNPNPIYVYPKES